MIERLICLVCLLIGYGFGLLQIAHIYSKSKNINIREKGSGNAGTTNMFRVMGIKAGIITLVGDCAKCVAAILVSKLIFLTWLDFNIDPAAIALYAGFGCVLGHDFPFYFHFKGGKGMAVTAALIFMLGNWQIIVLGLILFFGIVIRTKYVSLGSMVSVSATAIAFIVFTQIGWFRVDSAWYPDCYIIVILNALLLIFQHRKNIKRLLEHNEKKFYFRSAEQIQEDEEKHREVQLNAKVERVQAKTEKKVDRVQNRIEKKVDRVQKKADYNENKVDRLQNKAEYKAQVLQQKAEYKGSKVQLKAELKQENNQNWAGRIAEYAPKSFKQSDDEKS